MAANVFFNIIPAHWELIRAKEAGREPDPAPGIEAKRRSVHNNYFTLPVLITMLAGHFSFLTGQQNAWVVLVVMMAVLAWIRHFYNLRHGGTTHWWMPAVAAVVVLILVAALAPDDAKKTDSVPGASRAAGKKLFVENQCGSCHTLSAVQATGKTGPNLDAAKPTEEEVIKRVSSGGGGMPAFAGRLSKRDIASIGVFVANPGAEAEKPRGK